MGRRMGKGEDGLSYVLETVLGSSFLVLCLLLTLHIKALSCFDRSAIQ